MFPKYLVRLDYVFFANQLKINIARRNFFFETIVNEKILKFINLLYRLHIIRRFVRITTKRYRIYTAWIGQRSTLLRLRCYSRTFNPIRVSYKALLVLKSYTFNSYLILNTPQGLITHHEALSLRTGGVLICTII